MSSLQYVQTEKAEYRFDAFDDKASQYFDENGFCVIKNVLNNSQIQTARNLLWNFLNKIGWNKNDASTWNFSKECGHDNTGIFWGHGIGQSDLQWFIRKNKNVLKTFAKIWNISINQLITSFDGINIFRPWYINKKWKTMNSWYHLDQNTKCKPNRVSVQGYVSLFDQNEKTGSTELIPKSNLFTKDYKNVNISEKYDGDWIGIQKDNKLLQMNKILICCKSGDLVIWDSRTIHCNSSALLSYNEMRKEYNNDDDKTNKCLCIIDELLIAFDDNNKYQELLRGIVYVCMTPKHFATENVLISRVDAYINNYNLNHYPHEYVILNKPKLNEYPVYLKKKSIDDIDEMTKNLIGIDDNILKQYKLTHHI